MKCDKVELRIAAKRRTSGLLAGNTHSRWVIWRSGMVGSPVRCVARMRFWSAAVRSCRSSRMVGRFIVMPRRLSRSTGRRSACNARVIPCRITTPAGNPSRLLKQSRSIYRRSASRSRTRKWVPDGPPYRSNPCCLAGKAGGFPFLFKPDIPNSSSIWPGGSHRSRIPPGAIVERAVAS